MPSLRFRLKPKSDTGKAEHQLNTERSETHKMSLLHPTIHHLANLQLMCKPKNSKGFMKIIGNIVMKSTFRIESVLCYLVFTSQRRHYGT